jgi:hypothetical protein
MGFLRGIGKLEIIIGLVCLAAGGLVACPKTLDPSAADQGNGGVDGFLCKRPPTIDDCDEPPNSLSKDLYRCRGCTCAGPTSVAACNQSLGDCRHFYDGCYPTSYTICDGNAPDLVSAMCLNCFLSDAGGGEKKCDKLTKTGD